MLAFLSLASGFCFCFAFVSYSLLIVFIFEFFCLFSNFCYLGFFFFNPISLFLFINRMILFLSFVWGLVCLFSFLWVAVVGICFCFCYLSSVIFMCVCGFFCFGGFFCLFVLWPHCIACGLFIPWPGLGPGPSMAAPSPGC